MICAAYVRLDAEPLSPGNPFRADIAAADLGPLTLSRVRAESQFVQRSPALIRAEPREEVLVSLQLRGEAVVQQDDRQALLRTGDFAMYDTTRPYDLIMNEQFEMLVLQFERKCLIERCPSPRLPTAIRLASDSKVTALVSSFLRSLEPIALGGDNAVSRQLATSTLDLLGVALADQFGSDDSRSTQTKYFLRACSYINAYAADSDLTPAKIASEVGISRRYLHAIFKEHNMSVYRYLIKRRLLRCHDDLTNPQLAARTITDIAHRNGFKSSAHFSRCFSEAYGNTPSEIRRGRSEDCR